TVLDAILVEAAERAGAQVVTGFNVTDVLTDPAGRVTGVAGCEAGGSMRDLRARFVIGADGVRSRIARTVGAAMLDERPAAGAAHYTYVAGLDAEGFEYHLGDRGFAGVFPTHGGEANVWLCSPASDGGIGRVDREEAFISWIGRISPGL